MPKIVEVKTCDGVQTLLWVDGALAPLQDLVEVVASPRMRESILSALELRHRQSLTMRVTSYFRDTDLPAWGESQVSVIPPGRAVQTEHANV